MRRPIAALVAGTLLGLPLPVLLAPVADADSPGDAEFCTAGVASDFNGDGWTDAAVGDPHATVAGAARAGRVVVHYGDEDGRVGEGSRRIVRQGAGVVTGTPESGDRFGSALAAADLDCDGYADLVVGTPYEDIDSVVDAGLAQVVWGAPGGLGTGRVSRSLGHAAFLETVHAGDRLGSAVDAHEDVGQGGTAAPFAYAVAVGAPGWDVAGRTDAGWVGFAVATDGGNMVHGVTQDSPGVAGTAEAGDRFGAAVEFGYLVDERSTIDVAVGVPGEDRGAITDAGAVTLLHDLDDSPVGTKLDQDSPGVAGTPEAGDRFGDSLHSVRVGSLTDLVVGVPREDVGRDVDAGMVQLLHSTGIVLTPGVGFTQDTAGVSGVTEPGDRFGERVALAGPAARVVGNRVAVGVPGEDGAASDTGVVQVFPVADLGAETSWTQASPGVPGSPQTGDRFGAAVAVVNGPKEQALLVGVPDEASSSAGVVGVIPLDGGTPRAWVPGSGDIPRTGAARFGAVVAGGGQP